MQSPLETALAQVVQAHRETQNLSQEALAEASGLHRNYIGLLERGQRSPALKTVEKLAAGLGLTTTELVGESERQLQTSKRRRR